MSDVPVVVDALVAALPKAELHLHLEGAMPPALMLELAERHGVAGIPPTVEAVADWYRFRDFDHFLAVYHAAVTVLHDEDDFARLVETTAATLAAQNVRYAEIIVTPSRTWPAACRPRRSSAGWSAAGASPATTTASSCDGSPTSGLHSVPHAGESAEPGGAARMWSAVRTLGAERIDPARYMEHRAMAFERAEALARRHEKDGTDFPQDNPSSSMSAFVAAVEIS